MLFLVLNTDKHNDKNRLTSTQIEADTHTQIQTPSAAASVQAQTDRRTHRQTHRHLQHKKRDRQTPAAVASKLGRPLAGVPGC